MKNYVVVSYRMKALSIMRETIGECDCVTAGRNEWNSLLLPHRKFDVAMRAMFDAYSNAQHWSVRRQILAIVVADFPTSVLKQYFPNISEWKIKSARHHAHCEGTRHLLFRLMDRSRWLGRGAVVKPSRASILRCTEEQVEHFIEFILSPHIATDLPFGEKKMKLSSGEIIIAPNTIRNMIPQRIISQYVSYCKEIHFKPLGETVSFDILKACAASTRKCLAGLDTFSANGSSAFENLNGLCDLLATYGKGDIPVTENWHLYQRCSSTCHCSIESSATPIAQLHQVWLQVARVPEQLYSWSLQHVRSKRSVGQRLARSMQSCSWSKVNQWSQLWDVT